MQEDGSSGQWQMWLGASDGEFCQAVVEGLNRHRQAYIASVDPAGRILGCNDAMARLLGLSSDEFSNESIWDRLVEADCTRLRGWLELAQFTTDPILLNFVTSNHSPMTLDCSVGVMSSGHFVIIGLPPRSSAEDSDVAWLRLNNSFATLSRENARKSKQLELQNSELLRISEELRRANEALTVARTAALQAAQAKADFLHHMSHEIRTPMNGVMGMVQLLLATDLSPEQRRYATVSQTSGRSLLALIDDILDLSKMEAQRITLENLPFSVQHAIDDVVQLLSVLAGAKGLQIHAHVSEEIPQLVCGDAHRLRQVLTNLAGNAIKFTERGVVTVGATLECEGDVTATVRFAVTDTGIGIRPDQAQTLFSPFVQAEASTTRKYGGTGLGLAISKQLVELMGGKIGIESREGEGSTFWFTAVFETAPESVPVSPREPASAGERTSASQRVQGNVPSPGAKAGGHAARILIADDSPTNQAVALAQLELLGYQADAVADGAQAIEALEHRRYDLILMDSEMPVMDGYESTRRIRQSSNSNIPIIGVTAHAMSSDRDRCIREGMNDFLSKPVDLQLLAEVLAKWIPETGPRGEARTTEHAASAESGAIFESEAFLKRLMGDRQLAGMIIKGFLGDVPSQLNNLRKRFEEEDAAGARLQAHTLQGSAATVSAVSLRAIGQDMERAAADGQLEHFGKLLPRAIEEFERFKSTLEKAGWL